MAFTVKFMSDEDLPDEDTRKCFRLLSGVVELTFSRKPDGTARAVVTIQDGETFDVDLEGNVYAMHHTWDRMVAFGVGDPRPPNTPSA